MANFNLGKVLTKIISKIRALEAGTGPISNIFVKKAGDTMTGTLTHKANVQIGASDDSTTRVLRMITSNHNVNFATTSSGVFRLWDDTNSKTVFSVSQAGDIFFNGNASTATKATQDGSGNTITSTYVKKAGDTMSGALSATALTASSGLVTSVNNGVTAYFGAQNSSYVHLTNNKSIPFYFNNALSVNGNILPYNASNSFSLGSSSYKWKLNGNVVADTVIEQGTSGSWYYRKWSSGKRECWMKNTFTATCGTWFSNGVYRSDTVYMGAFPSGLFTTTPIVLQTPETVGAWFWLSQNSVTSSSAGYIMIHQAYSSSATTYIVHTYAYGY